MSTATVMISCLAMFCLGLALIVAGFWFYFTSTSFKRKLYQRLLKGLAVLCMIGSAGFLEYANYFMFSTLN